MKFFKKWRFLIVKLVNRYFIRLGIRKDYWVRISDPHSFYSAFGMFSCQFSDQIACSVLKLGWQAYEPPMGKIINAFAKHSRLTFLDIGANTGFYSLLASASGADKVFAYEPVPAIFNILKSNVICSGLNINLNQEAIANEPGEMRIYIPKTDRKYIETSASLNPDFREEHAEAVTIKVRSLDELTSRFTLERPTLNDVLLMKVDVESCELPVLAGGQQFFKDLRPVIIIELLEANKDRQEIYDAISSNGYLAYALASDSVKRLNALDMSSASDNYLFVPIEKATLISELLNLGAGLEVVPN